VFAITTILSRGIIFPLLGWLLHILIDITTHSFSYYATRFLWPVSDFRINGVAWWTSLFWIMTYAALVVAYGALWRNGWLWQRKPEVAKQASCAAESARHLRLRRERARKPDGNG
jgi:membrane-bound metal-dependent hydrolase YbcI (DUF457 family)